jgi:LPPG:FO 2-phospho-L-lactate transferase
MTTQRYLALTGGIGGAKLALGLSKLLGAEELAFVVNTADDFEYLGLHVSPDVDTLVYTLAEQNNPETGWGRRNESWQFMSALAELGGETWFRLGDKDLAMNIERTRRLGAGDSLSRVTAHLAASLGIRHPILPMSDDAVRTLVQTADGPMDFQDYFVRQRCNPVATGFEYRGAATARLCTEIHKWLDCRNLAGIILCPSSPFISIDPILSVPGLREALRNSSAPVIAISPVVAGKSLKGPLAKMMHEMSIPAKASWIAGHYRDFLRGFIVDSADEALIPEVEDMGIAGTAINTVMKSLDDRIALAQAGLEFIESLSESRSTKSISGV